MKPSSVWRTANAARARDGYTRLSTNGHGAGNIGGSVPREGQLPRGPPIRIAPCGWLPARSEGASRLACPRSLREGGSARSPPLTCGTEPGARRSDPQSDRLEVGAFRDLGARERFWPTPWSAGVLFPTLIPPSRVTDVLQESDRARFCASGLATALPDVACPSNKKAFMQGFFRVASVRHANGQESSAPTTPSRTQQRPSELSGSVCRFC